MAHLSVKLKTGLKLCFDLCNIVVCASELTLVSVDLSYMHLLTAILQVILGYVVDLLTCLLHLPPITSTWPHLNSDVGLDEMGY